MSEIAYAAKADTTEQEAINRLFELAQDGDTGNDEFNQLESLVYGRLFQSYEQASVEEPDNMQVMAAA